MVIKPGDRVHLVPGLFLWRVFVLVSFSSRLFCFTSSRLGSHDFIPFIIIPIPIVSAFRLRGEILH